jgi:hypothetical protein
LSAVTADATFGAESAWAARAARTARAARPALRIGGCSGRAAAAVTSPPTIAAVLAGTPWPTVAANTTYPTRHLVIGAVLTGRSPGARAALRSDQHTGIPTEAARRACRTAVTADCRVVAERDGAQPDLSPRSNEQTTAKACSAAARPGAALAMGNGVLDRQVLDCHPAGGNRQPGVLAGPVQYVSVALDDDVECGRQIDCVDPIRLGCSLGNVGSNFDSEAEWAAGAGLIDLLDRSV